MTLLREFWIPILVLDIYSDTKDLFYINVSVEAEAGNTKKLS